MRGLVPVLTVAFVFLLSPLLTSPASGQSAPSSASLDGTICVPYPYAGPQPLSSGPAGNRLYDECGSAQLLPGATVHITRAGPLPLPPGTAGGTDQTFVSDANGQYRFNSLAPGNYSLVVSRTGFAARSLSVDLKSGAQFADLALDSKKITVPGLVVGRDRTGVAGASVNFCCGDVGSVMATTGSDGRFSVSMSSGFWSVNIDAAGYPQSSINHQILVDGVELRFSLAQAPGQDANVHGTVTDQHGKAIAGATVSINGYGGCCYGYATPMTATSSGTYSEGSSGGGSAPSSPGIARPCCYPYQGQNSTQSDAQGRYSMHVYSGDMGLSAFKDGYAPASLSVHADPGQDALQDVALNKFPERTAHLAGRVTDGSTGKGLRFVQISMQSPEFGINECSSNSADAGTAGGQPAPDGKGAYADPAYSNGSYNGCRITIQSDGTFAADVTPGYAIVQVYFEQWRACSGSTNADGSTTQSCGPEYNSWSRSLSLADNATTKIDIALHQRPATDAVVSGYLIDATTSDAIPGAQISFSNEDAQGYGYATTDQDGSYKLRLRAGYHQVYANAQGHLHWQGVLDVKKGDTAFDVVLVPGTESYGGCCYYGGPYMAQDKAMGAPVPAMGGAGSSAMTSSSSSAPQAGGATDGSTGGVQYEDLGGGLGPYKANERSGALANGSNAPSGHGAPGLGALLTVAALAALLWVRRRL